MNTSKSLVERIEEVAQRMRHSLASDEAASFIRISAWASELSAIAKEWREQKSVTWVRLADSEWMNIVNHPDIVRWDADKEEAVNLAVKLVEQKLKDLNAAPPSPSVDAPVEALRRTWAVIDSAGIGNLANGVQLGPVAWLIKAQDARAESLSALAAHERATTK